MAKSKLQEKHTVSAEGLLDINDDGSINIEIEDIGTKKLSDILAKFNGCTVKLNVGYSYESTEE